MRNLRDQRGEDGRMMTKLILKKKGVKVGIGFIWLTTGSSVGLL
jgi:hypothetical protein